MAAYKRFAGTRSFWKEYEALTKKSKEATDAIFERFKENPFPFNRTPLPKSWIISDPSLLPTFISPIVLTQKVTDLDRLAKFIASVRGLTLAGGTVYLARADGTLWSASWTPGLEHGSPVGGSLAPISADPAQQWAARGMFVRNP